MITINLQYLFLVWSSRSALFKCNISNPVIQTSVHCFNVIIDVINQLEKYGDILDAMFTLFVF